MKSALTAPEQATPAWLTGVLRENGLLRRGEVVDVQNSLTKALPRAVVSRLAVTYSTETAAPSRLFLKISGPDPSATGKEVEFYRTVAKGMSCPPLIRCYDAAHSAESGGSHLLLDDLSETHFQTESPQPPPPLYRGLAVECLAEVHAFWWEHPRLGKEVGALFDEKGLGVFLSEVEKSVLGFIDFLGGELSAERRKVYELLLASKEKVWGHLTGARGLTVTHGDAHWWNLLYPHDARRHRVSLFDWELWHVDLGARDIAFMVALGGYSKRVAATEEGLVRRYHDALKAHGVDKYSWEDCWYDYRRSALRNLNVPVVQWAQGQREGLWRSNLESAMLAYEELKLAELLG